MTRIFKSTGKSPIINCDLFLETDDDKSILACLSRRDIFIIRSYLWPFVEWRTRLARPVRGNYWQESTDSEFNEFMRAIQSLEESLNMASCAESLSEIARAIVALANKPCCGDPNSGASGGVVSTYTNGDGYTVPIYGTHPPVTSDGETPPEGFDTYEDYLLNKCQVANLVFDGWLQTMRNFGLFTVFNATGLGALIGAGLAGIITLPVAAIPVMVGALLVLGAFVVMFHQIADTLESNREDIICDLYNSNAVETMTSVLADAVDVAIALLEVAGPIGEALKTVAMLLVNGDTLSQLMSGIAGLSYPDVDCSGCTDTCPVTFTDISGVLGGTGDLSGDGSVRTIEAALTAYGYIIAFSINCECSVGGMTLDIDDMPGYVPYTGGGGSDPGDKGGGMNRCDSVSVWSYADGVEPAGEYGIAVCQFGPQNTPFSLVCSITT